LRGRTEEFTERVNEIKRLNAESLSVIRDLAMGLRPSMLDDIGLRPALEWQGRQISRNSAVPVSVEFSGETEGLPELQRTCVYRAVQEALTNCVRHAQARNIRVAVEVKPGSLTVTVEDDGVGFDPAEGQRTGIGLLGIRERVEELGGCVRIATGPGKGTKLILQVPTPQATVQ
jgi:signal transduction histidine kinase